MRWRRRCFLLGFLDVMEMVVELLEFMLRNIPEDVENGEGRSNQRDLPFPKTQW